MARPPPSTGGPPISFKTVPGRHRTQKWNVARQYDYSGDDWGGYDPYEDYGEQQPPPPGMQQGGPYSAGPAPQPGYGGLPSQQPGAAPRLRQQSFDDGDERRAFSGPSAPGWGDVNRAGSPAKSAVSSGSGGRPSGDYARPGSAPRPRDFTNPEQVPPPLNTRAPPGPIPGMPMTAPPGGMYPPRNQGGSRGSPAPDVIPAPATTAPTTAAEKELPTIPFIRPSDIYKRMEVEKEKERQNSMDSNSRPPLDTSQEQTWDTSRQRPLSSVDEGTADGEEEEDATLSANVSGPLDVPHDFGEPNQMSADRQNANGQTHALPPIQSVSGFGSSMFGSSGTTDPGRTPTSKTMQSSSSSLQATPTATRAPPGSDPAAEILAERTHETPIPAIGQKPDELSHQASQASSSSQGFRSAVNRAFEDSTLSRDGSQSTNQSGDVSRSNTTSTSGISPIMSRAPWSEQMAPPVPTIAEEPSGRASSESSRNVIPRKPSPQQSANASPRPSMDASRDLGAGSVEKGYRRSLDPPSSDNSPARTPGLESAEGNGRRLSQGLAAQTVTATDAETDIEQKALEKTQLEERMGRPRAGTDYSIRESDLAHAVNSSPDKGEFNAGAAAAEKNEQDLFVQTHSQPSAPGTGFDAPASGRSSPSKGRVREIADKYQDLHNQSRRGSTASSKSSWSNFRGSQEDLSGKLVKRQGTDHSNMVSESDYGGVEEGGIRDSPVDPTPSLAEPPPIDGRPGLPSQQSFRPQLPGGWVSYSNASSSGTPGGSRSLSPTSAGMVQDDSRASWFPGDDGPVDLTPTTRKVPLEGSHSPPPSNTMMGQAKDAGTALGAALMSSVGLGHQTRDFGSSEPAPEVEVPITDRKLAGETTGLNVPERPEFARGDTEASAITTVSNVSVASRNSSRPPTPPAKDTPQPSTSGYNRENNYFSAAIAPLRTGRSREASPEASPAPTALTFANYGSPYGPGLQRDDSLRREIVRSLDTPQQADFARTQDALDAPENAARVAQGGNALPATEISDDSPNKPQPLGMLDQRFSWEQRPEDRGVLDTPQKEEAAPTVATTESGKEIGAVGGVPKVKEPEPESSPEIRPEMPYERPRSRGLHIMNASDDGDSDDERDKRPRTPDMGTMAAAGAGAVGVAGAAAAGAGMLGGPGPVSPITKSQENLHLRAQQAEKESVDIDRSSSLRDLAPSPISQGEESLRLPSYYMQDSSAFGVAGAQSPPLPQEESRNVDDDTAAPEVAPARPGPAFVDASIPKPPEKESSIATPSPTSPTSKQKIPPFREILAIKNTDARIRSYDDTRRTFADMNTGLSDWLSGMLTQNPEYASLSTETYSRPALQTAYSGTKGHKASPSLSKFTKQFGSGGDPQRSASVNAGGPSTGATPGGNVDMDKLQQRGKDLMKGAGALGGKAQAGAKGLFAKGKSRFGTQRESKGGKVPQTTTFFTVPPAAPNSEPSTISPRAAATPALSPASAPVPPPAFSSSRSPPPAPAPAPAPAPKPALSSSRSPPAAAATTSPSDSALAVPISENRASSVYSTASIPVLQPIVQPPDRSQTQTPASSSSASGALSRTLSRLRERSRSLSSSRRSRSRPQSLVLLSSNHGSELKTVLDASPRAAGDGGPAVWGVGGSRRGSEFGMAAISPWNEPNEVAAFGAVADEVPVPERLGVLPSPAQDSFSVVQESPEKIGRDGMDVEDEVGAREVGSNFAPVEDPREIVGEEAVKPPPQDETEVPGGIGSEELKDPVDEIDLGDATPKQISPTSATAAHKIDDEDESTPTVANSSNNLDRPGAANVNQDFSVDQTIAGADAKDKHIDEPETREISLSPNQASDVDGDVTPAIPEETTTTQDSPTIERQSTDLLEVPAIVGPSSNQEWDRRSVVSSNNDFHDAKEEGDDEATQSSRRSSVSSLGHDDDMDLQQPVMSSQAVPAGPSPEQSTLKPNDQFMNRPYQFGSAQDGRSKSYISLGQDSTGAPLQETLDIAGKPKQESMDATNLRGQPSGGSPFQRQPAVRDVSGETRPKRYSGMIKGRRPTLESPATPPAAAAIAPAASAISDQYGLEGLQDDAENVVVGEIPPHLVSDKQEDKKAKRKSGLFDSFRRSPSMSKTEASRESSALRLDSLQSSSANLPVRAMNETRSVEPTKTTAKTPQRASTTVKEPEQKKKRFSGLGSLFGRSSTTGHKSEKPRKLMKTQAPGREPSQRQVTEPVPNSEAYETMRQQRRAQQQERQPQTYPVPSIGPASHQYSFSERDMVKSPEDMKIRPPPGGWYGPQNQQAEEQTIPQEQPSQYRRLHNDGRRDSPFGQVPDAFRPVEASFDRPVKPVGPPPEAGMYSPPTSPVSQGAASRRPSYPTQGGYDPRPTYGPSQNRLASYASNESEISGESEWRRSEWRRTSSSPSVSPVQTRHDSDGYPPGRSFRVGSITEEMARSPAKEYMDQQTPWAISLPRPGDQEFRRGSRGPSYSMQGTQGQPQPVNYEPAGIGYAEAYPPPARWQNQRGLPMSPESPRSSMPMQQPDTLMSHAPVFDERPPRGIARPQGNAYPSPPMSPESQWFYNRSGLVPPPQSRSYGRPEEDDMPPPPRKSSYIQQRMYSYENDQQPPTQPRRTSGYTGRRDEPTIGEETVEMRGVSYPGQEWTPERWD